MNNYPPGFSDKDTEGMNEEELSVMLNHFQISMDFWDSLEPNRQNDYIRQWGRYKLFRDYGTRQ